MLCDGNQRREIHPDSFPVKNLTIIALFALGIQTSQAQQYYANQGTSVITQTLPYSVTLPDGSVYFNPASNVLASAGWLWVNSMPAVASGFIVSAYTISPLGNGRCNVTIAISNSIAGLFAASVTNSPLFTPQFVANCQQYRTTLRIYTGFGGESNAVVSPLTSYLYCQTNQTFLLSFTNYENMIFCVNIANQILQLPGITNSPQFWQLGVIP